MAMIPHVKLNSQNHNLSLSFTSIYRRTTFDLISFLIGRRDPDRAEEIQLPNMFYWPAPSTVLPSSPVEVCTASHFPHMSALGRLRYLRDSHVAVLSVYPVARAL